jgi:hypothetical protein
MADLTPIIFDGYARITLTPLCLLDTCRICCRQRLVFIFFSLLVLFLQSNARPRPCKASGRHLTMQGLHPVDDRLCPVLPPVYSVIIMVRP